MTTHDEMCTCDRCMREDHDRTLQRVGDLERENARLLTALDEIVDSLSVPHPRDRRPWAERALDLAQRALEGGPS
jgi:phage host-nuclease inhibitor protein Gam